MTDKPTAFHDLPADAFPFTIEFFRADTKEVVHTIRVEGPGMVEVPPLSKMHGGVEIDTRITSDKDLS